MRRALMLAALLSIAACAPRPAPPVAAYTPPAHYTPPYRDLLPGARAAAPTTTPSRDPWNNDTERDFMVALFGATQAMACKMVARDAAIELMVNVHLHPRFVAAISEARRGELREFALAAGMKSAPDGCNANTRRFYALLRDRYPPPRATARRAPPTPMPATTATPDTDWQPAPSAPRPRPPAKPDQLDL
jgi:hypothetical protein